MGRSVNLEVAGTGAMACRDQRAERGARGAVLDDAAAGTRGAELFRKFHEVDEPVEDVGFELGARRAGGPQHSLNAETGGQELSEDRRPTDIGREVGEEVRRLPMSDSRHDDLIDIA